MGEYIRINLIGKPKIQTMDKQHYVAIRYVGVKGQLVDEIEDYDTKRFLNTFGIYG